MTTIDSSGNVHRGEGSPQGGQFAGKQNTGPSGQLQDAPEPTEYQLRVNDAVVATADRIHPEWLSALFALRAVNPGAEVTLSGVRGTSDILIDAPAPDEVIVVEHQGDYLSLDELHDRGISLVDPDVVLHRDPLVIFSSMDERTDLDDVREALTVSPGDGPYLVDAALDDEDPSKVNVDIAVAENFLWDVEESEPCDGCKDMGLRLHPEEDCVCPCHTAGVDERVALLDEHRDIVEAVYREWFGAEVNVPESWDAADVTLRVQIDRDRASRLLITERAHGAYAKFRNETDPGTFGSPYVGAEVMRRIEAVTYKVVNHADRGPGQAVVETGLTRADAEARAAERRAGWNDGWDRRFTVEKETS